VTVLDAMTDFDADAYKNFDADAYKNSVDKVFPRISERTATDEVLKLIA
jgi:hypothetical protein